MKELFGIPIFVLIIMPLVLCASILGNLLCMIKSNYNKSINKKKLFIILLISGFIIDLIIIGCAQLIRYFIVTHNYDPYSVMFPSVIITAIILIVILIAIAVRKYKIKRWKERHRNYAVVYLQGSAGFFGDRGVVILSVDKIPEAESKDIIMTSLFKAKKKILITTGTHTLELAAYTRTYRMRGPAYLSEKKRKEKIIYFSPHIEYLIEYQNQASQFTLSKIYL
ncbi:MAG: hypothetical protein ACTTKU_06880 [Eggerthia catenaformis]|uniref:hypothetical protein n=1 Tax=Eggerthia catenaformis TaxID=31973 RepID=UPI003FA17A6C